MLNGDGLRVVLWCSGCTLNCKNCHNPQTHDFNSGILFTNNTTKEILELLDRDYISGLTLSGGHPLEPENIPTIYNLVKLVKEKFPNKTIWVYSGYTWEFILEQDKRYEELEINAPSALDILKYCDVLVDGKYKDSLRDVSLPWVGSSNQRVINIPKSLESEELTLWTS